MPEKFSGYPVALLQSRWRNLTDASGEPDSSPAGMLQQHFLSEKAAFMPRNTRIYVSETAVAAKQESIKKVRVRIFRTHDDGLEATETLRRSNEVSPKIEVARQLAVPLRAPCPIG